MFGKSTELTNEQSQFLTAARLGSLGIIQEYIEKHRDNHKNLLVRSADGHTALHEAAIHGHIAIVNALIKAGADVDAKTYEGSTPLINACTFYKSAFSSYENYYAIIEALISSGADVNAVREKYSQTKTALSAVITDRKEPDPKVVSLLLKAGANAKFIDTWTYKSLYELAKERNYHEVALLLKNALRVQDPKYYIDLFIKEASNGDLQSVQEYIKTTSENSYFSIDSFGTCFLKDTALHNAVRGNQIEIVKLLLASSASIDPKNIHDDTPLLLAACFGRVELIHILISAGADTECVNKQNETVDFHVRKKGLEIPALCFQKRLDSLSDSSKEEKIEATPSFLVCSISMEIFSNPITLSSGHTYELSSLQTYAENTPGNTFQCPLTRKIINKDELSNRVNRNLKAIAKEFVVSMEEEIAGIPQDPNKGKYPSVHLICPLTGQPFLEPITLSTGYTYELSALRKLPGNNTSFICPLSEKEVSATELTKNPCHILRTLAQGMTTKQKNQGKQSECQGQDRAYFSNLRRARLRLMFVQYHSTRSQEENLSCPPIKGMD